MGESIITITELTESDVEETLRVGATIFCEGEPLEKNDPSNTYEKSYQFFKALKPHLLLSGSTIAKDGDKIIGCRLAIDESNHPDFSNSFGPGVIEIWGDVRKPFETMYANPVKGEWAHFVGLCVDSNYTNQGIARRMYQRSEQAIKDLGYKHIVVETSSAFSYAAVSKLGGYELMTKISYADYIYTDGVSHYKQMAETSPHKFICLFVKHL